MSEQIRTKNAARGSRMVTAIDRLGVWAMHQSAGTFGEWTITHIPTGLAVARRTSMAKAKRLLLDLGQVWPEFHSSARFGSRPKDDDARARTLRAWIQERAFEDAREVEP